MALGLKTIAKMGRTRYKRSLFIIPYFFTFANALFGFLSVIAALKNDFVLAASYIGLAACMDACDGRLARAFGSTSYLGAELDGLCDAISFCCAPPVLLYCFYQDIIGALGVAILALYLCAGLFRLAKFNCTTQPTNYFSGLATPVSAFFLVSLIMYFDWMKIHCFSWILHPISMFSIVIALAFLMLSTIPFPSFKSYKLSHSKSFIYSIALLVIIAWCWYFKLPTLLLALLVYIINPPIQCTLKYLKKILRMHKQHPLEILQ